jgi:citrate lyase subunit beta/citryl-CoA lyase
MREYVGLIEEAEANHGVPAGYTLVRPVTETAEGAMRAFEIFSASDRIAYAGGTTGSFAGDLGRSVGMDYTADGIESLYLRSKLIIEARVAGVPFPIGGGPTAVKTVDALREFALQNKKLGYDGFYTPSVKYYPKEAVAAVNEVFTPTKEEVDTWLERDPTLEHPRMRERVELARRLGVVSSE